MTSKNSSGKILWPSSIESESVIWKVKSDFPTYLMHNNAIFNGYYFWILSCPFL